MRFPDDIWSIIIDFTNDLNIVKKHKKKLNECAKLAKYHVIENSWVQLMFIYDEYQQLHEEWRLNDHYFDPDRMREVVQDLYAYYMNNKYLLMNVYRQTQMCNCCKYCQRKRLNIEQMSHDPHDCGRFFDEKSWHQYEIVHCTNYCNNCMFKSSVFYDLEFRNLWSKNW